MRVPLLIAACALSLAPAPAAVARAAAPPNPSPLVLSAGLGGGAEAGLESGQAGLLEAELAAGWDVVGSAAATDMTVRPELAVAIGFAPDSHVALRPGVRVALPGTPLWLRAAVDWSNARGSDPRWRWLLLGAAWELRLTGVVGLAVEVDSGLPLGGSAGLPLLVRAGVTVRP